jgi:hypothetical protein
MQEQLTALRQQQNDEALSPTRSPLRAPPARSPPARSS